MDSDVAPKFIFDQGLYYPAPANYYGYYCTGMESPCEWDDRNGFFGLDGQDQHFSGLQTESLPYVYYTPSYEYAESPYNPYNPYIPGAVIGSDGPFRGTQQYITNPTYQQTVSSPAYIPVVMQSTSDAVPNSSPDPLVISTGGAKLIPPISSGNSVPTSLRLSLENPTVEPSQSVYHQIQIAGRLPDGSVVNTVPSKQFSSHGAMMTRGSTLHVTQGTNHFSHGSVPSACSALKATMPANNGFTNFRSNVCGWATGDRFRPRFQLNRVLNGNLGEQNKGPRLNRLNGQFTSQIALRDYKTKADTDIMQGTIILHANQYNKDDFPMEYPGAKFFVIKSYSEDDVHKSIKYNVWSSTPNGNKRLDCAYEEAQRISVGEPRKCPVFLLFSVNASGQFCGVAEMIGPVDFNKDMDFWQQDTWTGSFPVKWHIVKDVPNSSFRHIILVNNECRPVTNSRDTQEIPYLPGMSMLTIFKSSPLKTSILDDFLYYEERERLMHEDKSKLLRRRNYDTSLFRPTFVPSNRLGGAVHQPPKAYEKQLNGTVIQHPIPDGKDTDATPESDGNLPNNTDDSSPKSEGNQQQNGKLDHPPTSDGKPQDGTSDDKPSGLDGKQLDCIVSQTPKGYRKQPNANPPPKGDGRQPNHMVEQTSKANGRRPLETERNPIKHGDDQVIPKLVPMNLDDSKDAKGDANNCKSAIMRIGPLSYSEVGETDVVTVGSMHIKVKNNGGSLPGILTIGSVPADTKGVKL